MLLFCFKVSYGDPQRARLAKANLPYHTLLLLFTLGRLDLTHPHRYAVRLLVPKDSFANPQPAPPGNMVNFCGMNLGNKTD